MRVSQGFRSISEVLEELEDADVDIIGIGSKDGLVSDESVRINLQLKLPVLSGSDAKRNLAITLENTNLNNEGDLIVDVAVQAYSEAHDDEQTRQDTDSLNDSPSKNGKSIVETESDHLQEDSTSNESTVIDAVSSKKEREETPAYKDPERLQQAYETYDTFAEMTEALNVEVRPETVRRHMIKHGIHDSESYKTDKGDNGSNNDDNLSELGTKNRASSSDQEEIDVTTENVDTNGNSDSGDSHQPISSEADDLDKIEISPEYNLPNGISLDELTAAVSSANTLYEVQKQLDLESEEVQPLLQELDLLDFVVGRLSTKHERDVSPEDVRQRLQNNISA